MLQYTDGCDQCLPTEILHLDYYYVQVVLPNHRYYLSRLQFQSGGIDHTHQYIVANVLSILNNDKGNGIFNDELNAGILMEATDWPDKLGNETDYGTFSGHFYDPDTGKNWLGQSSPMAQTRAESYYQNAVTIYKLGDVSAAMDFLGKGTHYVSDMNEPHQASNLTELIVIIQSLKICR